MAAWQAMSTATASSGSFAIAGLVAGVLRCTRSIKLAELVIVLNRRRYRAEHRLASAALR